LTRAISIAEDQNRLKPCRGKPFGLYNELEPEVKNRNPGLQSLLSDRRQPSAPQPFRIVIDDYRPEWASLFSSLAGDLRGALGVVALRIDHIGSTSVPGLAAKPIIDTQVSVLKLEPVEAYRPSLEAIGYQWRASNPELTKRYFRELPGGRRTHIHVRRAGSWNEQWALLFRDYMRTHREEHEGYAALKRSLAEKFATDMSAYTDAKGDLLWQIIRRADEWASISGWEPGPSDA
jgi:GrpB-like predicted nucleotidyltransferase (UPF0157 family)